MSDDDELAEIEQRFATHGRALRLDIRPEGGWHAIAIVADPGGHSVVATLYGSGRTKLEAARAAVIEFEDEQGSGPVAAACRDFRARGYHLEIVEESLRESVIFHAWVDALGPGASQMIAAGNSMDAAALAAREKLDSLPYRPKH